MSLPTPRAAVVSVGDELLLGRTVDTNAAWLGRRLAGFGVEVVRRYTVSDRPDEIRRATAEALTAADLVLLSGGLGPTPDDLTREAVAELLGRTLTEDAQVLRDIEARFRERGVAELPEPNRKVAQVPAGALKLANPHGTAPGLAMEEAGRWVVLLPGVPRELRGIVDGDLAGCLAAWFGDRLAPVHVRQVHTTGIPESALAEQVASVLPDDLGPVRLAFLPDLRGVDLRLTVVGVGAEEAARHLDRIEEAIAPVVGPWRFAAESGDLVEAVVAALRARGLSLAVAESCTGGRVLERLTGLAGVSEVLRGGVVAYADAVKRDLVGVPSEALERHGAVSEPVARAMAEGVCAALGADAGIGITGIAGPGGGSEEKPVGTVWLAASVRGVTHARRERFPGDRAAVRERAGQAALALLLHVVDGREREGG